MGAFTKPPMEESIKRPYIFKKRRAGIELTKEEVKTIRQGRKELRKKMRKQGIRSKKEFELTASSLGLYFDKNRFGGFLLWLFRGRGLWALLGAAALLLLVLFLFSTVSQMRGHFTINLSQSLFREGFTLSETKGFESPTTRLFADPSEDVPCVSVLDIAQDVNMVEGKYENQPYFAYTFYLRNEGQSSADYAWEVKINSESKEVAEAVWFMVFEDDQMRMFAKAGEDGNPEALPARGDDSRGYRSQPFSDWAMHPESLYETVRQVGDKTYYRLVPEVFESDEIVASGTKLDVMPMDVHKYTVVIWMEGDDPDCTDEKISGHLGVETNFRLLSTEDEEEDGNWWSAIWRELEFFGE